MTQDEHPAVRRNIPSVIARIPCPRAADLLLEALADPDRQLRFEAIAGLGNTVEEARAISAPSDQSIASNTMNRPTGTR